MTMLLESFSAKVSLAVRLTDDFSRSNRILGGVLVYLVDRHNKPIKNRGGYHVFPDLAPGNVTIQVLSQYYLDEDRTVSLPLPDPLNPVLAITLKPNWLYPFPQNATLISGRVLDKDSAAVPNAQVQLMTLEAKPIENRTSSDGRFVLYATGLVEDDVQATVQGLVLLASSGETSFRLKTTHAGFRTKSITIKNVKEGETHFLTVPITLKKT